MGAAKTAFITNNSYATDLQNNQAAVTNVVLANNKISVELDSAATLNTFAIDGVSGDWIALQLATNIANDNLMIDNVSMALPASADAAIGARSAIYFVNVNDLLSAPTKTITLSASDGSMNSITIDIELV